MKKHLDIFLRSLLCLEHIYMWKRFSSVKMFSKFSWTSLALLKGIKCSFSSLRKLKKEFPKFLLDMRYFFQVPRFPKFRAQSQSKVVFPHTVVNEGLLPMSFKAVWTGTLDSSVTVDGWLMLLPFCDHRFEGSSYQNYAENTSLFETQTNGETFKRLGTTRKVRGERRCTESLAPTRCFLFFCLQQDHQNQDDRNCLLVSVCK